MNLAYPTESVRRSVAKHNCDLIVIADWLELAVLMFDEDAEGITRAECVALFVKEGIYDSQDFCAEFFESVFSELRTRQRIFGLDYPIRLDEAGRLAAEGDWTETPGLAFCLLVSTAPYYSGYSKWVGGNYVAQGELFERLTTEALMRTFPQWNVSRTGWNGGGGVTIMELVGRVAGATDEVVRAEAEQSVGEREKDLGVDVAAVRRFGDDRASLPVIFTQCASGRDWHRKILTPDTSRWRQLVTFTHSPLKALSLPFRIGEFEYRSRRSQCKGLLMDRLRLLPTGAEASWVGGDTRRDLVEWLARRREWLIDHFALELI